VQLLNVFVVIGETADLVVAVVIYFPQMRTFVYVKKEDTATTIYVRIWGKYITTAITKSAVSPITTKTFNTRRWPYWPKPVVYLALIFNY
jgi:hypothetical protein